MSGWVGCLREALPGSGKYNERPLWGTGHWADLRELSYDLVDRLRRCFGLCERTLVGRGLPFPSVQPLAQGSGRADAQSACCGIKRLAPLIKLETQVMRKPAELFDGLPMLSALRRSHL